MATQQFHYSSLNQDHSDVFRLMMLTPGDDNEPIKCRLVSCRRHDAPSYRALSYTWGVGPPVHIIKVNGADFKVSQNLYSALVSFRTKLRTKSQAQTLWIDFICINQDDVLERNHQVLQMQEIYAGAVEVLIWLGPSSPKISLGLTFVKELCASLGHVGIRAGDDIDLLRYNWGDLEKAVVPFLESKFRNRWNAVAAILSTPWWTRAWVIQESACSPIATFHSGGLSLPWTSLALVIRVLFTWHPRLLEVAATSDLYQESAHFINHAWDLVELRHSFRAHKALTITSLLDTSRRYHCQDPRDKVYSVLGLTSARGRALLSPDYSKPVSWVYAMAIKVHVYSEENLNILRLIGDGGQNNSYPSWTVDLDHATTMELFRRSIKFNSSLNLWNPPSFSEDLRSMIVDGFSIDVVDDERVQGHRDVFVWDKSSKKWDWEVNRMTQKIKDSGGLQNAFESKSIWPAERTRQGIEGTLYDVATAGHSLDHGTSIYHQQSIVYSESDSSFHEGAALPRPQNWDSLSQQATVWTSNRTLILTNRRFLGLVPSSTKSGDHIFILFGYWTPVVLHARSDRGWTFVGSAYIPGFMRGEAVAGLESGLYTRQTVELR